MLEEIGVIKKIHDYYYVKIRIFNSIWTYLILEQEDFDRADRNEILPVTEKIIVNRPFNEPLVFNEKRHRLSLSSSRTAYIIDLDTHNKRLSISKFQKKAYDRGETTNIPVSEITQHPTTHEE